MFPCSKTNKNTGRSDLAPTGSLDHEFVFFLLLVRIFSNKQYYIYNGNFYFFVWETSSHPLVPTWNAGAGPGWNWEPGHNPGVPWGWWEPSYLSHHCCLMESTWAGVRLRDPAQDSVWDRDIVAARLTAALHPAPAPTDSVLTGVPRKLWILIQFVPLNLMWSL